ncbi:hypothetical protein DFS34DRAFT_610989 [Phlyctochytrium arcticum]|nr:hypothetical protein DFS34DRAFT_610989 [Phlyctochytrium arcticum]
MVTSRHLPKVCAVSDSPTAGYYTCQVMGYVGAFWGITSQSFTFLFILERYMSLVHRFTVNNWQAKQMVLSVYISGLVIGATPFMFGRRSSVAPTGVYCRPICKPSALLPCPFY